MATALLVGSLLAKGGVAVAGASAAIGGVSLATISTGLSIASGVFSFFQGQAQASAQQDQMNRAAAAELRAAEARAGENRLSAQRERTQAAIEEAERQRRLRRGLAAQKASFAGGSADIFSGSLQTIQDQATGSINRESRLAKLTSDSVISSLNRQALGIEASGIGRSQSLISRGNAIRASARQTGAEQLATIGGQIGDFRDTLK